MPAPTNTLTRPNQVGVREELEGKVYKVSQEDRPFSSMIGKEKAKSTRPDWQTVALAARNPSNAALEGSDVGTHQAARARARIGVECQIFTNDGIVSGTAEAADVAGVEDEIDFQKMIKGIELINDMEARFVGNYAAAPENPGVTAKTTAGALAWIKTNDSKGAGGTTGGWTSGGSVSAAGNGTQRPFTESQIKALLVTGFTNGARYKAAFMSGTHKQIASAFTGIADIRRSVGGDEQATITAAADRYVSDFGPLDFIPHPDLTRDCLLINPEFWKIGTYRGVFTKELASNGDNIRWETIAEKCLMAKNEKMGAAVRDLT